MIKEITYKNIEKEERKGFIEYDDIDNTNFILKFNSIDLSEEAIGKDYFNALCNLRLILERKGIQLVCNGASLNIYPSGMSLDMGNGLMAYHLKKGLHPTFDDLVYIFELNRDIYRESTVNEQKEFFEAWNNSTRIRKYCKPKCTIESIPERAELLFFWGHRQDKYGNITKSCLSQWWPCSFSKNGILYSSTEQWMMAEKARAFRDHERLELILNTNDPKQAKIIGRQISNFNEDVWNFKSYSIVKEGNLLKFSQDYRLKEYLKSTKNSILVEASPYDKIWGIGMKQGDQGIENPRKWQGKNLLGFALMEVRDVLI